MLRAAIEGIKQRGNSDLGDKTLLDALRPAVDDVGGSDRGRRAVERGAARRGVVAREQAEATRGMLAKRGRASYTGERSIGTLDAGAVGVAVMFEEVAEVWASAANVGMEAA